MVTTSEQSGLPGSARPSGVRHVLSFDIEDWFHIVDVPAVDDPAQWLELSRRSSIVERYTDLILDLCRKHQTRATFFVLGWIADRHPELVARVAAEGHELATHSFWHRRVYTLTAQEFLEDLRRSIDAITAAAPGASVRGFRAPSFSITPGSEWAFDTILRAGLAYDASLFPGPRGHGGYDCPRGPHVVETPKGARLVELPMSVAPVGLGPLRHRMCYSGGGYLRLLPSSMIHQGIEHEAAQGRGTVVYLHPRDFAPDCPRVSMPPARKFKCYVGLSSTTTKLERLLDRYEWMPCVDALADFFERPDPSQPSNSRGAQEATL
ncbi:MAG: polysaccharide deacetylase family protein [Phycisphaerales bacterium]|jgi:polysaccharide deacetylase family protein (PEP-CTERM system associated)